MENKIRFILFGLIAILAISLFIAFQNYSAREALQKEKDRLTQENTLLTSKAGKLENALRDTENKMSSLNKELDRISQEKNEIERKYELAKKGQNELLEKLKAQQHLPTVTKLQVATPPSSTDAYWAGILKEKTDLELQLANIRNELRATQISNEQLQREKSTLGLDVNTLSRDNEDLKRQLEYNQKVMDSITQELVREKNDKIQIQNSFKLIKNENAALARQLKNLNNRKIEFEKELQQLQQDKRSLERRLTDIETMLTDKISKVNELKEQLDAISSGRQAETKVGQKEAVELPPIVVRPQTQALPPEAETPVSLTGKVLAVNRDNNFVIIDLGEERGIKVGEALRVYRQNTAIADIEVIQARQTIAACDIKKETKSIAIGDTVK